MILFLKQLKCLKWSWHRNGQFLYVYIYFGTTTTTKSWKILRQKSLKMFKFFSGTSRKVDFSRFIVFFKTINVITFSKCFVMAAVVIPFIHL